MSRHGKLADDSERLNVVLPKAMSKRMSDIRTFINANSISDTARICIEYGLQKVESFKRKADSYNGKRD